MGDNPSSYLDLTLGELNSINVNFVGNVEYPGVYPLHPFSSLIEGLVHAGGIDTSGTLRNIEIKRFNKKSINVDLYDFLIKGYSPDSLILKDQDIVVIKSRKSKVIIDSSVVNPGIYEAKKNETVYDLINYAGGLALDASGIIGLKRILEPQNRTKDQVYESSYISLENAQTFSAEYAQKLIAQPLMTYDQYVEVLGQVKLPGKYYFKQGTYLSKILELSGGFEDTTFSKSVFFDKGEIIRRIPSKRFEDVIPFNIKEIIEKKSDIPLHNLDKVVVHANVNYFEKKPVQILGEVGIPGSYPVLKDDESLERLLIELVDLQKNHL